jgi:hypothetical protein
LAAYITFKCLLFAQHFHADGPVRADNTRKRTYRTKEETEASKSVTSTVVLTLLFIAVVVSAGPVAIRRHFHHSSDIDVLTRWCCDGA